MPIFAATTTQYTAFSDMATEMSAYVPGCPTSVIANVVMRVVTDLCSRAGVWREYSTTMTIAAGTYEYTVTASSPIADVVSVLSIALTISGNTTTIYPAALDAVMQRYPYWPSSTTGTPQTFAANSVGSIMLAPVPSTAGTAIPRVVLQPKTSATVWPTSLYSRHERVIFHGVLHDLMSMPGRAWSDPKMSLYHGKQWTYLLDSARVAANSGFQRADVAVQMRPMA